VKLTDMTLQKLPIPERGQKLHSDDSLPGFAVRVSQGGTKTFLAIVGKERRFITIGRYGIVTLSQARERAKNILAEHQLGIVRKPVPTLGETLRDYLARREKEVRESTQQADGYLFKRVEPLKNRRLDEITPADIEQVIDAIRSPSTRRSIYIRLSGLFSYAVRRGQIERSPVKAVEIPSDQEPRHRVFTDDEVRKLLIAARMRRIAGDHYGAILELLIYTLQRRTQIAALTVNHIDIVTKVLTWSPDEMKGKKRHIIPLMPHIENILKAFPPGAHGLYFPNNLGQPFTGWSYHFRKLTAEIGFSNFVIHDLRRLGATAMQRFKIDIATTEKILAHNAVTGGLVGVYQRHSYLEEMQTAFARYHTWLDSLVDHREPFPTPNLGATF
jgi:integrase